jgi:hypothetical protein
MKKILAVAVLALAAVPAMAQHHGYHGGYYHHRHGGGWGWAPFIGGAIAGAVVYDIYNRPVVVQQQPVIVQPQPTVVYQPQPNCSPWTETQNPDGTITRTRTCTQ